MSGDFPFAAKIISPVKCNEKPWDLWVSEIGHLSPRRDEEAGAAPADGKPPAARAPHPYKTERARYRRAGHNRLRLDSMPLHGIFPQMDNLNAAVCHMCGVIVKCNSAYRHLLESHTDSEPILPPPAAPTVKLKVLNRSRHKKDVAPAPLPPDFPVKMETSPVHTTTPPLSRIVLPQPDMYLEEPSTSTAPVASEVQVCVESGELPVVCIPDTEDLPLGENITDDIFAIMNSEGIQSADDITNAADWKNIIRDIGNMQEINFSQTTDSQSQDLYNSVDTSSLSAYTIADTDLSSLQFAPSSSPMLSSVIEPNILTATTPALKTTAPATAAPSTPSTKSQSRSKTSKSKFNREYDPNKHCGVVTADNPKPCTRSLTCKAHALSLRRTVEGRAKPFDTLLAEHRAARDAHHPPHHPPPAAPAHPAHPAPPLVNTNIDLSTFNGLTAEQQVNDIYASLLSAEDPDSVLPDTSSITSLLSQPLPAELLLPDEAEEVPLLSMASPEPGGRGGARGGGARDPPPLCPADVCWYPTCPRPLALCTYNAAHAGGAITIGKKFATVRSNIKSSLSRSQCKTTGSANNYYYNQNALSLSKTVHMNASKSSKPEVRKLIVTCSGTSGNKDVQQTLSELFGGEARHGLGVALNGHVPRGAGGAPAGAGVGGALKAGGKRPAPALLDLGFALDPLLADEKC